MDRDDLDDLIDFALFGLIGYAGYEALKPNERKVENQKPARVANLNRDVEEFSDESCVNLQKEDPKLFLELTRMTPKSFEMLNTLMEPLLEKNSWRKPISATSRLFITLIYLAQGTPRHELHQNFGMGQSTIAGVLYDTCDALWKVLQPLYLSLPTEENWKEIAEDFQKIWDLPNCISAIDGKQIIIRCAPTGSSEVNHYKRLHSIEVLAACDAEYTFTAVDVETNDKKLDNQQSFRKTLLSGDLNLPPPAVVPNSDYVCNYYFVGNSMFPLKSYLLRPYPVRQLDEDKQNLNKHLLRAHRVIENAFGILVARWRVLQTTLNVLPDNAERLVKACFVLHNFCKLNDPEYCPKGYVDVFTADDEMLHSGEWRKDLRPLNGIKTISSNTFSHEAFKFRDSFKDYLMKSKIKTELY